MKSAADINKAYMYYVLKNNKQPNNVFSFAEELGITENEFYDVYASLDAIETGIWGCWIEEMINTFRNDENFTSFSASERYLSFLYGLTAVLKENRSFVHWQTNKNKLAWHAGLPKSISKILTPFFKEIVAIGLNDGSIAPKPMLEDKFYHLLGFHTASVIKFWLKDESKHFENTDAFIEKSVRFAFDILGSSIINSGFEFGKFVIQQARYGR